MSTTLKLWLGIVGLVFILGTIFLFVSKSTTDIEEAPKEGFYKSLMEKNNDFAYAEGLSKSGKHDEARDYYTRALDMAEGPIEEAQLKHKIALSYNQSEKPFEAVALLKEIEKNESYTKRIRAYAVQNIGKIVYSQNSDEIRTEVFKDEPYHSFLPLPQESKGRIEDYSVATRKLFEYATSLYPLGVSELRVAKWYSSKILEAKQDASSTEITVVELASYRKIVSERLASTDAFINNMEAEISDEVTRNVDLSEILWKKGSVLTDLLLAGEDINLDIEALYKRSVALGLLRPALVASSKHQYAIFLARTNKEERREDILKLLGDFYETIEQAPALKKSIAGEKEDNFGSKGEYLLLAEIDPRYKDFLINLGWTL